MTDKRGRPRKSYRVKRHGVWIADCDTLEELSAHVDLAQLMED